jgi:type VI secretion system protein ImpC
MLRCPYGAKTEPIESFVFEEFTPAAGLRSMLWANGSILAGLLLGKTFSEQGLKSMELGSIMTISDVPFYYYTDADGDQMALPSTERNVSERAAAHVIAQHFMPVVCVRGRPEVRLASFNSLAGTLLAGPWAPVEVPPDEGPPPAEMPTEPAEEEISIEETESQAAAEAESELDALLVGYTSESSGGAETTGETAEAESDASGSDDVDLDALLSGLSEKDEQQSPAGETEMDPDLAALLADL